MSLGKLITDEWNRKLILMFISGIALLISFFDIGNLPVDAAWIAIVLCGVPILAGAVIGVVLEHDIKADVLVAIALVAAVIIGEIFAAGEIALIMQVGAALEERTSRKAIAGIEKLVDLTPRTARCIRNGFEETIDASDVAVGDRLRVLAGETVPADGKVITGKSAVDQSILTGESLPVDKSHGDDVFSGTVNQFGTFEMVVSVPERDSSLQRMIRLVKSADAGRAKIVRKADKWATWIVVIALVSAVLAYVFTGEIVRSVTVLVVFCPCALVLATPTAIVAAIGNLTKHGILVKEGDALERMAMVDRIVFDKTGTLTYGKPAVTEIKSFVKEFSSDDVLEMAAAAELRSEHPLGKAVVHHAHDLTLKEPECFELILGKGVTAKVDGKDVAVGNAKLMNDLNIEISTSITSFIEFSVRNGGTTLLVSADGKLVGALVLSDTLRADAESVLADIMDLGTVPTILTGDNSSAAGFIARSVHVTDVRSDCLPEDKVSIIKEHQDNGGYVCMIGDGVNDAPALRTANVSVAMGGIGSDVAIDAADIALVKDDIREIPHLLRLSKRTMRTIVLNLSFSMILNFTAIGLAMMGVLDPVTGALVHNAGSVLVVMNSALLLNWGRRRQKTSVEESKRSFAKNSLTDS